MLSYEVGQGQRKHKGVPAHTLQHLPRWCAASAPTVGLAVAFWQLRAFLSQMDVPTKESYTMAIVGSDERVAMARLPLVGSSGAGSVGPSVTTAL